MARRIAKEETEEVVKTQGVQETQETESSTEIQQEQEDKSKTETKKGGKIPENVEALMKLYPHMKEMIINSKGFLFTPGTPQSMHNDGILYKNKFFNNN